MGIGITAVGAYLPEKIVSNADLGQFFETSDEWIISRTGIHNRRVAGEHEYSSSLGIKAVQNLLERYPEALGGIDLVICCTSTPDARFPSTAALIAQEVGLVKIPAFDLSAACAGFSHGLNVANALIAAGQHHKILLIGAETMSKILDWHDRTTAILFGDGAGAVILERVPEPYGIESLVLGGDGAGGSLLYAMDLADRLPNLAGCNPKLTQNGREVFKFAVRTVPEAALQALEKAGLTVEDLDFLVPHQANIRIIEAAMERLKLPQEKVVVNLDQYGNTSAASIPIALSEALETGRIQTGNRVMLVGFGGGLSWSAALIKWYNPAK